MTNQPGQTVAEKPQIPVTFSDQLTAAWNQVGGVSGALFTTVPVVTSWWSTL